MTQATTIDEVLDQLTSIINDSIKEESRAGYFAALYFKVTSKVKEGIENGRFEDGARMEKLDVVFANRYLDAYYQWKRGAPMTGPWRVAFETTGKRGALILQQLFLGMNAHINLDLGIAAVETMQGKDLQDLSRDFDAINSVIGSLSNQVIRELDRVSPLLSLLGFHATNYNSILIQFSIDSARDGAWRFAEELKRCVPKDYQACISEREQHITSVAESLIHASPLLKFTIWFIHLFEWKKPSRIIREMYDGQRRYLKVGEMR